jgi:hypothetical protein
VDQGNLGHRNPHNAGSALDNMAYDALVARTVRSTMSPCSNKVFRNAGTWDSHDCHILVLAALSPFQPWLPRDLYLGGSGKIQLK